MKKDNLPKNIYILPLKGNPVFPGMFMPIEVSDELDKQAVSDAADFDGFGLLLLKEDTTKKTKDDKTTVDSFHDVGTYIRVKNRINNIYGSISLYVEAITRFKIKEIYETGGIFTARVEYIEDLPLADDLKEAYLLALKNAVLERKGPGLIADNLKFNLSNINDPGRLADFIASMIADKPTQQTFLEEINPEVRIKEVLLLLKKEKQLQKLQSDIQSEVTKRINKRQREFFLREELQAIKEELNGSKNTSEDGSPTTLEMPDAKLIRKLQSMKFKGEVAEAVNNELIRFSNMESMNPEKPMLRNYLQTIAGLPWNDETKSSFSIENARKILNADHYGIDDVKKRILEFMAVRKLKKDEKGSIICLVGPPGVGKTSVGISIARALNKKYYRFSVGGMRDEAEIKGHRRTYIGAMPGQIIKGLMIVKTKSPVFVIDEIDKLTVSNQGDPSAALLEVFDPEQNSAFRDHYLDLPFDVSNVLFIVTANTIETIPRPLLDRMECIQLNGYTSDEKLEIGRKYLVPKSRKKHGLTGNEIRYSSPVLKSIAEDYAREAGVRNFEKALDKIHRKVALEIVENKEKMKLPIIMSNSKVEEYLGKPIFREDEILKATKPGMSIGLAWTSMGGATLAIEAQNIPGNGHLSLTGQLGDVMQESAKLAYTYLRGISVYHGINPNWFVHNDVHIHVPEGATPKDGPSAGITLATAMFSLVTNQVIAPDLAMTGELSLLGKVLPIGGLKEKVLAARRNRIKTIIIPAFNSNDLDKLDAKVKDGIKFHLVKDMEEVISIVFSNNKYPYSKKKMVFLKEKEALTSKETELAKLIANTMMKVQKNND